MRLSSVLDRGQTYVSPDTRATFEWLPDEKRKRAAAKRPRDPPEKDTRDGERSAMASRNEWLRSFREAIARAGEIR